MDKFLTTSRRIIATFFLVSQILGIARAKSDGLYTHVALKLPPVWVFYDARDLSENGLVAGYVRISNFVAPFDVPMVWNSEGSFVQQPLEVPFIQGYAVGFSPDGKVLGGHRPNSESSSHPGFWGTSGYVPVPFFGRGGGLWAANSNLLLGETANPLITDQFAGLVTLWDSDGSNPRVVSGLENLASRPTAINNGGTYVGTTRVIAGPQRNLLGGFMGRDGAIQAMLYTGFDISRATDVNDANQIVGTYRPGAGQVERGYIAKAFSDDILDLGLFPGIPGVQPQAINNHGVIVGTALSGTGVRALIWQPGDTQPTDFNTLVNIPGETLVEAMDINNAGQILARGFNGYYIFTPIPEPAAVGAIGLAAAALRRVRRG